MMNRDLFPDAPIPLPVQIAEIEREIALRARVYPRWVVDKRLSQAAADRQIAAMQAVLRTLHDVQAAVHQTNDDRTVPV